MEKTLHNGKNHNNLFQPPVSDLVTVILVVTDTQGQCQSL